MTVERRGPLLAIVLLGLALVALAVVAVTRSAGAQEPEIQRTAETITPDPSVARGDRGRPGRCPTRTQLGAKLRCIYGKRRSSTNAVVFGDSKAMQHFPALNRVAHRRGWRLVGLMRAGCPPMVVKYAYRCDTWRKRNLRRLDRIDPELVITSAGTHYQVVRNGRRLSRKRSRPILRRAYIRTLNRLGRNGTRVAVLVNPPRAPEDPVECVIANREALDQCAFERGPTPYRTYVTKAAHRSRAAQTVDINQVACPGRICPAVIDDILVMRDRVHLTATFVRTLDEWLDERLPTARGR
ncbi:MAG: SGNH hydrolase domain-containing protein [Thermoleophilaceae bacterium]